MSLERNAAQAKAIVAMIAAHLPQLKFDDPALNALPRALRSRSAALLREAGGAADAQADSDP